MADVKISELPLAAPLTGSELLLISQDGVDRAVQLYRLRAAPEVNARAFSSAFSSAFGASN